MRERQETAAKLAGLAQLTGVRPTPWLSPVPLSTKMLGLPTTVKACFFDLEGVLTDSALLHAWAWSEVFDDYLLRLSDKTGWQFIPFDRDADYRAYLDGRPRLEGIHAFLGSRGIRLREGRPDDPADADTACGLATRKGEALALHLRQHGVTAVGGARRYLEAAGQAGLKRAVVSASASTLPMLELAGLATLLEERVDADVIRTEGLRARPAPDVLLLACSRLGVQPEEAVTFTHNPAGVAAGLAGGLNVIGVAEGARGEALLGFGAERVIPSVSTLLDRVLSPTLRARLLIFFTDFEETLTEIPSPDVAQTSVIEPEALEVLVAAPGSARLPRARADGSRRRDRLRRPRLGDGASDRLDRRAGAGQLPAGAPRRRSALRLRRRAALLEAVPVPARVRALAGAAARRAASFEVRGRSRTTTERVSRSWASGPASCTRSTSRTASSSGAGTSSRDYAARREDAFVVAVNCFEPGGTCFCVSMGTGPKAEAGYDLALTEILDGEPSLPRRGRQRAREPRSCASSPRRPAVDGGPSPRPRQPSAGAAERDGPHASRRTSSAGCSPATSSTSAGTTSPTAASPAGTARWSARPASARRVEDATDLDRRAGRARARLGFVLLRRVLLHPRRQRPAVGPVALPPVAHAQARHVARPVRHLGLRRVRPLHHLVPGRDRRHRGGRRDPRERGDAMRRVEALLARGAGVRRACPTSSSQLHRRAARRTCAST